MTAAKLGFDIPPGLTLEKLWEYLYASSERFEREKAESAKRQAEFEQRQAEFTQMLSDSHKKWEERFEHSKAEADQRLKEIDRILSKTTKLVQSNGEQIGGLHNSFGEMAEHLVGPGIVSRFAELGYSFRGIAERQHKIPGKKGKTSAEVDMLLENEDTIIAVEVKSRPRIGGKKDDVAHHVLRLERLREHRAAEGRPAKRILGAIAGAVFLDEVKSATLAAGLFAIEQSGDTMRIDIPEGFVPQEW